ncbi:MULTISPECIES: WD40 repeat domain-containing protein [Streptomyces]|uniref:WD40 repeat domain-containing protein n=1 Tax=Streptomyces TaxID=1883 RepID=UPI0033F25873
MHGPGKVSGTRRQGHNGTLSPIASGGARTLAFRPDGTTLATVGDDGQMWVWSPLTGTPAHPFTDDSIRGVTAAAFHPAGTILAAAVDRGI